MAPLHKRNQNELQIASKLFPVLVDNRLPRADFDFFSSVFIQPSFCSSAGIHIDSCQAVLLGSEKRGLCN